MKKVLCLFLFLSTSPLMAQKGLINEYFTKGLLELQLGDYDEAIRYFNSVIQMNPQQKEAYFERGKCYMHLEANSLAISDFNKAAQLDADYADAYLYLGSIYFKQKDYEISISCYNKTIKIKPDYALAYNYRAEALRSIGLTNKAIEDYDKAIEFKPKVAQLFFGRGKCRMEIENYLGASQDFTAALELDKKNELVYYQHRLNAFFLAKYYAESSQDIEKILDISPQSIELYHYHLNATCKSKLQDYEGAIGSISKVIEYEPNEIKNYMERADYYLLSNRKKEALEDYLKIATLDQGTQKYDSVIVYLYYELNDYPNALIYCDKILGYDSPNADIAYMRAVCRKNMGIEKKILKLDYIQAAAWGYPEDKMTLEEAKMAQPGFRTWAKMRKQNGF